MTFNLDKRINEYMLREQNSEAVFARAFMNITWNLICQSKNTTATHLHHLEWTEDFLSIYFSHIKNVDDSSSAVAVAVAVAVADSTVAVVGGLPGKIPHWWILSLFLYKGMD